MQAEDTNGNLIQDEVKPKSDDFFDDVPSKTPEPTTSTTTEEPSSETKDEQPMVNGVSEEHDKVTEEAETGSLGQQEGGGQEAEPDMPTEQKPKENGEAEPTAEATTEATPRTTQEVQTDRDKYNEEEEEETQQQQQQQEEEDEEKDEEKAEEAPSEKQDAGDADESAGDVQTLAVAETQQDRASKASSYDEDDFSSSTDTMGATPAPPASAETGENSEPVGEKEFETPLPEDGAGTPQDEGTGDGVEAVATEEHKTEEDDRAEDAAAIPVVVDEPEMKSDGRSTPGVEDKEGNRGEDRPEETAPEGTEDSRGQGQWRPEDQQAIEEAVMMQKSDREQLDELKEARQKLQHEYDALKARFDSLLQEMDKQSDQIVVGGQVAAEKEKRIRELEEELEHLRLSCTDAGTVELRDKIKTLEDDIHSKSKQNTELIAHNEEKDKQIEELVKENEHIKTTTAETDQKENDDMRARLKSMEEKTEEMKSSLEDKAATVDQLRAEIERKGSEIQSNHQIRCELAKKMEDLEILVEDQQKELDLNKQAMRSKEKNIETLEKELLALKSTFETAQCKDLTLRNEMEVLQKELRQKNNEIQELKTKDASRLRGMEIVDKELESLKSALKIREDNENVLRTRIAEMETEKQQHKTGLGEKEEQLAVLKRELSSVKKDVAAATHAQEPVKDLQERLAILARENEEKDRRIFKLEGDLKDTTGKLRDTERKLFAAETSNTAGTAEPQKSKTCIIM